MSMRCLICGKKLEGNASGEYHVACSKKLFGGDAPLFSYSTEELNRLAANLVTSRVSVPGVQPKLSLHLERMIGGPARLTLVGLDGDYILKLPMSAYPELTESEHFAMLLANACGIETAAFGLVRLANGELAYITRRMDREGGVKAMEDFCQLTERPTEKKYFGSYEQIGRLIRRYAAFGGVDALRFFEVVLFCYLIGNSDMHLKNFSLLRETKGVYNLSSAYDLVPVKILLPLDNDELALNLNGKKSNLKERDFAAFAESLKLTSVQYERTVKKLRSMLSGSLQNVFACSFLSMAFREKVETLISKRISVFDKQ